MALQSDNIMDMFWQMWQTVGQLQSRFKEMGFDDRPIAQSSFKRKSLIQMQPNNVIGMTRALCVETLDPYKDQRVRFFSPLLHDPETPIKGLPYAKHISAMGGHDDCGLVWVPPAGSTLALIFENGNREAPFYLGTVWQRDRGPGGGNFNYPVLEYFKVYNGHRKGYLVGPNDESQCLPPWNTENYNGFDIDSFIDFILDPTAINRNTFPNIYGMKTPEKHMIKMVDGDPKCNRRWKRFEIQSSTGHYICLKDDHLHYGGQWSNPKCPPNPGGQELADCATTSGSFFTDLQSNPIEGTSDCGGNILGGHPRTPTNPPNTSPTKYAKSQTGSNPYFKHENECYPIKGPGTPQNNKLDLPQSGIQILSRSGITLVMDDSVEEPRNPPLWERSLEPFDFGCNDVYLGRFYVKTACGHGFFMIDEETSGIPSLRGKNNGIKLLTASGNRVELNDHTIGEPDCPGCPPNLAGPERGIHIQSTSDHLIRLSDNKNEQCSPCRKEGGTPSAQASEAFMLLRSGYGISARFDDAPSQQETQDQYFQLTHPQQSRSGSDPNANVTRGPHVFRFQGKPEGSPGIIWLRAGGHCIRQTYDDDMVQVGDRDENPSNKFTYVSNNFITHTEATHFRYAGDKHIFFAENRIILAAGRDCPPPPDGDENGPCIFPVLVRNTIVSPRHPRALCFTQDCISTRVFASTER